MNNTKIESALMEIADSMKEIADSMKEGAREIHYLKQAIEEKNGKADQTVGSHRIGALRRISESIEYMSAERDFVDRDTLKILDKIREILLGTGGD